MTVSTLTPHKWATGDLPPGRPAKPLNETGVRHGQAYCKRAGPMTAPTSRVKNPIGSPPPSRPHARLERHARFLEPHIGDTIVAAVHVAGGYLGSAPWKLPRAAWRNRDVTIALSVGVVFVTLGIFPTILWAPFAVVAWAAWNAKCEHNRIDRQEWRRLRRGLNHAPRVTGHRDIRTLPDTTPEPRTVHLGPAVVHLPRPLPAGELIARNVFLRFPPGIRPEDYERMDSTIAGHYSPAAIAIRRSPRNPDYGTMRIEYVDILERELVWKPQDGTTASRVLIGRDRDAQDVLEPIHGKAWLIAGVRGSGKSAFLNATIARLAPLDTVELYIVDPAEGVDLGVWHHRAAKVATNIEDGLDLLEHFEQLRSFRVQEMARAGVQIANPPRYTTRILVIDELASLMLYGDKPRRDETQRVLGSIMAKGRKSADSVIAATQHPSTEVIPSLIRTQFTHILGLRVMRPEQHNVIFGEGAKRHHGYDLSDISPEQPGRGVWFDGSKMTPVRTFGLWGEALQAVTDPRNHPLRADPPLQANGSVPPPISPSNVLSLVTSAPSEPTTNEQKFKRALEEARHPLTVKQIAQAAGIPLRSAYDYTGLPYVEKVDHVQPATYRLKRRVVA